MAKVNEDAYGKPAWSQPKTTNPPPTNRPNQKENGMKNYVKKGTGIGSQQDNQPTSQSARPQPRPEQNPLPDQFTIPSFGITLPTNIQTPLGNFNMPKPISGSIGGQTFQTPAWLQSYVSSEKNREEKMRNVVSGAATLPGQIAGAVTGAINKAASTQPNLLSWNIPSVNFGNGYSYTPPAWLAQGQVANPLFRKPERAGFQGQTQPAPSTSTVTAGPNDTPRDWIYVQTANGLVKIPWQPGMTTGSFYSGGGSWNTGDMRSRATNRNEGFVVTPPTVAQQPTTNGGGGSGTGGGGGYKTNYKRPGGGSGWSTGGGYSSERVPSWLMNLINWNFRG